MPLSNITLAIDDEILDKVRVITTRGQTTLNALVQDFLAEIAGRDEKQAEARKELLRLMETSKGRMAPDWKFNREETHER